MVDFKRLNKIIEKEGSNPNRTIHDLVREQLRKESDFSEYHLDNISEPVEDKSEAEYRPENSPVHENIAYAEKKLSGLLNDKSHLENKAVQEKAAALFETIEKLKCKSKLSWTEIIETAPHKDKSEK